MARRRLRSRSAPPLSVRLISVHETRPDTPCFATPALIRAHGIDRLAAAYHALLVASVIRQTGVTKFKGRTLPAFTLTAGQALVGRDGLRGAARHKNGAPNLDAIFPPS